MQDKLSLKVTYTVVFSFLALFSLYCFFGHSLLSQAYSGNAPTLFNGLISGQQFFSLESYSDKLNHLFILFCFMVFILYSSFVLEIFSITASLRRRYEKAFNFFAYFAISLYAFYLAFQSGRNGFFALDQSIIFDGAYRIISGQTPYRDFFMPIGPVVFWIQAVFFKLFGVNYTAYLLHSAFVNMVIIRPFFLA